MTKKAARSVINLFLLGCLWLPNAGFSQITYSIHLLDPWNSETEGRSINIRGTVVGWYPGISMEPEGNDWYHLDVTLDDDINMEVATFHFVSYVRNNDGEILTKLGISPGGGTSGGFMYSTVFSPCPTTEIWITPNDTNPPTINCFEPENKTIFLFNPWHATAPTITFNGVTSKMYMGNACDWFVYYINEEPVTYSVVFNEMFTNEYYGRMGLGDTTAFDLTTYFSTNDTVYILPTPQSNSKQLAGTPVISVTKSNITGLCSYNLGLTIRDFSSGHPDFEFQTFNQNPIPGMVQTSLGENGKPVQDPTIPSTQDGVQNSEFESWFNTNSNTGVNSLNNYQTCVTLPFKKTWEGYWEYSSLNEPSHGYFPIDDFENPINTEMERSESNYQPMQDGEFQVQFLPDPTGALHNFHFCSEIHAEFTYQENHSLFIAGDDDVWAFINNSLVVDLGGVHLAAQQEVSLNDLRLTVGERYPLDVFQCERLTTSSHFIIRTSLFLEPPSDLSIGVSPEAVEQGLPNCNIPDSSVVSISPHSKSPVSSHVDEQKFLQFLKNRGYPRFYSKEKDGYYTPSGVYKYHSGRMDNPK